MESMYYREFGIPARIARCFSVEEAEEQKKLYDGKKNCYVSVYTFDDLFEKNGKTEYTSAVNLFYFIHYTFFRFNSFTLFIIYHPLTIT